VVTGHGGNVEGISVRFSQKPHEQIKSSEPDRRACMPPPTAIEILKLCDDWCAAATQPGGGIAIGGKTEKFRLLANGIVFHELDHECLCAALIGLSKVLLRPRLNTIVDSDHFAIWSWCGELLLSPRASVFPINQREIKQLFETTLHASLANCRKPVSSKEEWQTQNRIGDLQPHHAKYLVLNASLTLVYMAFPLLEALLKRACSHYVAFDGQVRVAFQVQSRQGGYRQYDPQGSYRERQCSSLRDILVLHYTQVAVPRLKILLDSFADHIRSLDQTEDHFAVLYRWRNQSLHGTATIQTIGGTVLNLALLVSLFEIEQDFDQHRAKVLEYCRWESCSQHKSPWSFYPPY
jgi:hypothetical protein